MAVYTEVTDEALAAFLADYDIGSVVAFRGIAEGVENSNFSLRTTTGDFILTLYEKRVDPADLPWFLGLMEHLARARHHLPAAGARTRRRGAARAVRPARRDHHLPARRLAAPGAARALRAGRRGAGVPASRRRRLRADAAATRWARRAGAPLLAALPTGARRGAARAWPRNCSTALRRSWPAWPDGLPVGHIHADLFPDNVFFLDGQLSGLIDFYFAATDLLAYDIAVCLNAWCFEPDLSFNVTKARAMLPAYAARRTLSDAERAALPVLCQGAAIRFLLTRLYDWVNTPPGALVTRKDPIEYRAPPALPPAAPRSTPMASEPTGASLTTRDRSRSGPTAAASPTPARAAGARSCASAATSANCRARDPATTNNRMELTAAAAALEALKRPCRVVLHTDSEYVRNGITRWHTGWVRRNWRNACRRSGEEHGSVAAAAGRGGQHEIDWRWVRGHAGDAMNERADDLATAAREDLAGGARE